MRKLARRGVAGPASKVRAAWRARRPACSRLAFGPGSGRPEPRSRLEKLNPRSGGRHASRRLIPRCAGIIAAVIRDGMYYGAALLAGAAVVAYLAAWGWAVPLVILAAFALYFFRNPSREVSAAPGAIVSPADGRITHIDAPPRESALGQEFAHRISIFLSIFDVHVQRAPTAGRIAEVRYRPGRYLSALDPASATENEQNLVYLEPAESGRQRLAFSQIAGLIARRIVFWPRPGDRVRRGQLVGLIKFGSRVEVFLPAGAEIVATAGQRVRGGTSLLGWLPAGLPDAHNPADDAHSRVRL